MDKMIEYEYPELDLTPLLGDDKYVVFCQTEYEARCLLAAMKIQFPEKCTRWSLPDVKWHDTDGRGQLYFPDINDAEGMCLCWNDMDYPEIDEYTVVEFEQLLACHIDLDESDMPVDFLFGGCDEPVDCPLS